MPLEAVTTNLSSKIRRAELEGVEHLVVPVVMLTEGVHAGSNGPLYYPAKELGKSQPVWNYRPIVVYHPTMNGVGISACDPEVLNKRKVGVVLNTKWDSKSKKLRAEAWLNPTQLSAVDQRIVEALDKEQVVEVSTGLFTDNVEEEGEWNGEAYTAIARNYRPDHLALLPDQVGACSVADGAGLLQLNAMSHNNIWTSLASLLRAKYGDDTYIVDVFDSFVIYERPGAKLFRVSYTQEDNEVKLGDGEPQEVKRVTEYRTSDGSFVGNLGNYYLPVPIEDGKKGVSEMDKKAFVDGLIANKATAWEEGDREALMAMPEETLKKMVPVENTSNNGSEVPPVSDPAAVAAAAKAGAAGIAAPTAKAPATVEEYISNAPAEFQDVLRSGLDSHNAERSKQIAIITANKANTFTVEQLNSMSLNSLRQIAAFAAVPEQKPVGNFLGAAPPVGNAAPPAVVPLPLPTMDFGAGK